MTPEMAIAITGKNMAKPAFDQVVKDANRAASAVNDNGAKMAASMNGASFQTANLAAQFNDIGVMLAAGQSPLLLALQQGTQISQVLGPMGAAQAVNALKTAFISLFNPISLVTIGSIAAGAALFQYFTSLQTDGRDSTEVIKEQNDLLAKVAQNWGDAVPALKAYLDQLDRAANLSDLDAATEIGVQRQFEVLQGQLGDWRAELAAARVDIQAFGGDAQEIDTLQRAFETLDAKMRDGTASTADLDNVLVALAGTAGSKSVPSLIGFANILEQVRGLLAQTATSAATLRAERDALMMQGPDPKAFYSNQDFVSEQNRVNGLTAEQLRLEREIARVRSEAKTAKTEISDSQALSLAQQRLDAEERRARLVAGSKSGDKAAAEILKERQAVADLIEELEFEQSLIGATNTEKAIQNALRQAGAAATDEERQRIRDLITVSQEQQAAQKLLTEQWTQYGQIGETAVRGVIKAMRDGKIEASELSSIMDRVLESSIDLALSGIFGGGGGNGNWLQSLLGGILGGGGVGGGPVRPGYNLPGYAGGTDNFAGGWARVNEVGGELINLPSGSQIVPHDLSLEMARGGGGATSVSLTIVNEGGGNMQVKSMEQSPNASGGIDLKAIVTGAVKESFADGSMDGLMSQFYGLTRKGF